MTMTSPVLVTGGTGTLGRLVTPLLHNAGCPVRVFSRSHHQPADGTEYVTGDLSTGEGIGPAVDGVTTILHLAGGPRGDEVATGNLARAAAQSGVRHLVYISVIGADRVPLAWFGSKLAAELAIARSGVPWTTLRAAQFHDLVLAMLQKLTRSPVLPAPTGLRLQPVDTSEVAARLVELTLARSAGRVPDLAGPKLYRLPDLIRGYLPASGKRRLLMPVRIPGKVGRAYRAGDNLARGGAMVGKRTWEDFLTERLR
jgi:uncharacterized protein YbjT (DUF2867 family)